MDALLFSLFLATNVNPHDGNIISEPQLLDYVTAVRAPGITGKVEEVIDRHGNPAKADE